MRIDVVTIFPEMFAPVVGSSILKRAQAGRRARIQIHNLRDYTTDKRRTVDDRPYGGGPGMVMKPEPIFKAVEAIEAKAHRSRHPTPRRGPRLLAVGPCSGSSRASETSRGTGRQDACRIILMAAQGTPLTQAHAQRLCGLSHLVLIAGHYEGVDERVRQALVDEEISIGDYVLTGGELPAMVLMDSVVRLIPGVLGHARATEEESFADGWLEYPQYTRPPAFRGMAVPEALRCGHHEQVARWRKLQAVARTFTDRPDMVT